MPINVYTGLMRSGKSYEVVASVILDAIRQGRRVVTNVDGISSDLIREYVGKKHKIPLDALGVVVHVTNEEVFKNTFLPYYDEKKSAHTDTTVQPGDLVCIDEAWRFWGTDCKLLPEHKSFFLEHGHFTHPDTGVACDLVLMIQDMGTLHRFVKNVVAFNFRTHKKVSLGLGKVYSITMYEGKLQNKKSQTGNWVKKYDPEIFPLYSSFKGGADGKMVNADSRQNIFASKKLWFMALFMVVTAVLCIRFIWLFFHPKPKPEAVGSVPTAAAPGAAAGPAAGVASTAAPVSPGFSDAWRVAGSYEANGVVWVVVANSAGRLRVESPSMFSSSGQAIIGTIDGQKVTVWTGAMAAAASPGEARK